MHEHIPPRRLHRFAVLTACATFALLIAGSLVTSTDSGLAVPDWPLSYGTWFPPMVGGIVFEHGHRMIAGIVGLMIFALAVWLARAESRPLVRRLGYAALGAVAAQALLGGLTVLLLLPPAISIAHACLGQLVFCLVVLIAWGTRQGAAADEGMAATLPSARLQHASLAAAVLAGLQLALGAVIRHTGYLVAWHILTAAALGGAAVLAAREARAERISVRHAVRLALLLALQLCVGLAVLGHRHAILLRTLHVGAGALVLAQAVLLACTTRRLAAAPQGGGFADYLELTKPRLSGLVLVTTAVGYWLGAQGPASLGRMALVLLGTALTAAGANALNQWMEQDADAQMRRTQHRPLPAGRLRSEAACRFGVALISLGIALLAVGVNWLSACLAALSASSYLFLYTPLKRMTPLCTLAGAVPGALPPVIGWAAARNALGTPAAALFALLFVWQLPHFLALAELFRDDYARAGFRMLSLEGADGRLAARQLVLSGLALVPISLFPTLLELSGARYFYGALMLSAAFLALSARAAWVRSRPAMRATFSGSIVYLSCLLVLLAVDKRAG